MEPGNNVTTYKKSLIKSIIKNSREIITQCGFKYRKDLLKILRRALRSDAKAANDENENDDEYLQGIIDRLNRFKKHYLKKIITTITTQNIGELKISSICLIKMKMKIIMNQN